MASYIVEMDGGVHADSTAAQSAITSAGASISTTFDLSMTYEIDCTADQLAAMTGVKYSSLSDADSGLEVSALDTTHFKYIDNRWRSLDGNTMIDHGEWSPAYTGDGKTVYLLDSGINANHVEFANASITNLWTAYDTNPNGEAYASDYEDNVGHGTAVGSLIVGENIGTAKDATLMNVKLYDQAAGTTSVANVVNALNKVIVHHNANDTSDVKVLCAPWITTQNDLIDSKIMELNNSNVVVVAAAGNKNQDVNTFSPAGVEQIITVGSHDRDYKIASFTNTAWDGGTPSTSLPNYGAAVDILTVGTDVCMATSLSNTAYVLGSGTSLSSGLVAGGAAAFIEKHNDVNSNKIKEILIAEGQLKAQKISLNSTDTDGHSFYTGNVKYPLLQLDSAGSNASIQLFTTPSGVVGNVQRGQSITVDLGLNGSAANVGVLSFSPLSPWMSFDTSTGILTADASGLAADKAPAFYTFGVKGKIGELFSVEEFTVGVYETNESELEGSVNSYYYDSENTEYDLNTSINYELSPQYQTNVVNVLKV
jgi:subtilisin family serine protease